MTKIKLFGLSLCLVSFSLLAQGQEGAHLHGPGATIGAGITQFDVLTPSPDMKMGSGTYLTLSSEKPFGTMPLYLEAQFNYMHTTGTANYNYVSASNIDYVASNVNFALDVYDLDLGLKFRFLEAYPIRPYVEVCGTAGFFQNTYDNSLKTPSVLAAGGDYKTVDGVMNFGFLGEAGFDVHVASALSLVVAYKYSDSTTQPLPTVKNQSIHFINNTFYGGLSFRL